MEPSSANCYPGTTVLVNKFDIRDDVKRSEVEAVLVSARSAEWMSKPLCSSFDFQRYREIHRYLFADLYDWAGMLREINISKKGTLFCPAAELSTRSQLIFHRLSENNCFCGLGHDAFVEQLLDFYCVTNELHPFREGNGRTQGIFLTQLIENAGYHIDFADIDSDLLMLASIQSSQGVTDLLRSILMDAIT